MYWQTDLASYVAKLEKMQLKAWEIRSAIGFCGYVVGKEVASV
jgi:hypothetical protein